MVSKSPPGKSVLPMLLLKSVSPENKTLSIKKQALPVVWPGVKITCILILIKLLQAVGDAYYK